MFAFFFHSVSSHAEYWTLARIEYLIEDMPHRYLSLSPVKYDKNTSTHYFNLKHMKKEKNILY